jgi:hypothetical protein
MAVGSGAQVALAGGSFTDIVAGAAVGVIVGEAAGMLGAPVNTALGGYTGAFAGGAVAGFTQGMATAELYGGNAIRAGYQGAIVGAAMGVAVHALQQSFSPTPQTTDSTRIGVDQSRSDQPVTLVSGQNLEPTIYHGYDPGTGLYSITFHALPGFTPGTAVSANIEYMVYGSTSWESFYTQGMPVPGVWNGDFVTFSFQPVKGTNLGPEYGGSITNYLVTPTGGPSVSFSAENP